MRLTNNDKKAFVRAVMNDVPKIDYDEQLRVLLTNYILSKMPPSVRKVWDDKKTREYIFNNVYYSTPVGMSSFRGPAIIPAQPLPTDIDTKMNELAKLNKEQYIARDEIETKVSGLIYGTSTLKQAIETLTENLHKYLPANRDGMKTKNVPAVRDTVKALKDAGWPVNK